MPEARWFRRPYRVSVAMAIAGALLSGADASARLPEAIYSLAIRHVGAIHYPTGCVAVLEYDGAVLIGAFITDPLCLPPGVKARPVPAFRRDFHIRRIRPATRREIFTDH